MVKYNLNNHKDDIFATENYGKNSKIYIKDILDRDKLLKALYEFDCQEISISREGLDFLKQQYGLNVLSDMIIEEANRGVDFKYSNKEEIAKWLQF